MKIICFIDNLGSGGAQRQMVNLAVGLKREGNQVTLLTYYPNDFFLDFIREEDIEYISINEKKPLRRIYKIRKILKNSGQDAVISFLDTPNFIASLSSIGSRNWKLIVGERSANRKSFESKKSMLKKYVSLKADFIVTNSYIGRELWEEIFPKAQRKIHTIYNGVSMKKELIKPYHFRKSEKLHLVIAASYQELKNINGLIEALILLNNDEKEQLKIDWYGRKEVTKDNREVYEKALQKIVSNNLQGVITLHDETSEVTQKMSNADIVALFSHYEGLPNTICEGMYLGKPIIMTKVSDYKNLVSQENGFICDSNDSASIAEVLKKSISLTSEELKIMGEHSREKADNLFNYKEFVKNYISLLKAHEKI